MCHGALLLQDGNTYHQGLQNPYREYLSEAKRLKGRFLLSKTTLKRKLFKELQKVKFFNHRLSVATKWISNFCPTDLGPRCPALGSILQEPHLEIKARLQSPDRPAGR